MSENKVNIEPASEDVLKTLDLVILIDHSGSMESESNRLPGKTRYQEVEETAIMAANVMSRYDDDGITLVHFATTAKVNDGVKADAVAKLFKEIAPGGNTMLAVALKEVVKKVKSTTKETVALVFTDGEASDEAEVLKVLNDAGTTLGRPRIGFTFIQVGTDSHAKQFLDRLDNSLKVDVCATFSEEEAEGLSIPQLINAARTE